MAIPSAQHLPTGSQLGRYRIEGYLSEGAMGAVYRAHNIVAGVDVAIKQMIGTEHTARFDGLQHVGNRVRLAGQHRGCRTVDRRNRDAIAVWRNQLRRIGCAELHGRHPAATRGHRERQPRVAHEPQRIVGARVRRRTRARAGTLASARAYARTERAAAGPYSLELSSSRGAGSGSPSVAGTTL